MWLASLLLLPSVLAWTCGVSREANRVLREQTHASRNLQEDLSMKFPRNTTLANLRIHVEYGDLTAITDTALLNRLQNTVLPSAIRWYQNTLQVYSVADNVIVPQRLCGNYPVPLVHQLQGVSADFILYVHAVSSEASYSATAFACAFDGNLGNPVAGMIEYNPDNMGGMSLENEIQVTRHELAHALGFDPDLYDTFHREDGSLYTQPYTTVTARGYTAYQLSTPRVLEAARAAFGCPTLTGVPFDQSGDGLTHWSKRIMFNDFMTSDLSVRDVIYSNLTMAVFEDSGWYSVDYSYTDAVYYGAEKGCAWFTSTCVSSGTAAFPEFCSSQNANACDFLHARKGHCDLVTQTNDYASQFQYFADPKVGGSDSQLDFCPTIVANADGDCKGRGVTASATNADYGEAIGDSSKCFTGNYMKGSLPTDSIHSGCHTVICELETAYVMVGTVKVACPVPGGEIYIEKGIGVPVTEHFAGTIKCPPYEELCGLRPCINGCSGVGACQVGGCQCNDGFSGVDCSTVCDETCRSCTDSGSPTSCATCYGNATLSDANECLCNEGFAYSDATHSCEKIPCHASCETCEGTAADECTSCHDFATLSLLGECECNSGYYLTPVLTCDACHPTCLTCSGPGELQCLSCPGNLIPTAASGCICSDQSHFDPYIKLCIGNEIVCSQYCKTCSGDGPAQCTSCTESAHLIDGGCKCDSGYSETLSTGHLTCVYTCHASCLTCSGPFATQCLTCADTIMTRAEDDSCSCPAKYNFDVTEKKCKATFTCHSSCKTCYGPSEKECSSCGSNFMLTESHSCVCESGFVLKGSVCLLCHSTCATCTGTLATACTSCHGNASMIEGAVSGRCTCNNGYYLQSNSQCGQCLAPCATCADNTKCTSCKAVYATLTSAGACQCPAHSFLETTGDFCSPCHGNCSECSGAAANQCKACYAGMELDTKTNTCYCPEGQTIASPGVCRACSAACKTCSADANVCLSCDTAVAALVGSTCECLSSAYASASGQCRPCHPSCVTCKGGNADQCLSCSANAGLRKGECVCRYGYYMMDDMKTCDACDPSCGSCIGPKENNCDSCKVNAQLAFDGLSSYCECKEGFFRTSKAGKCMACDYSCSSCSGPTDGDCTECAEEFTLKDGHCVLSRQLSATSIVLPPDDFECSVFSTQQIAYCVAAFCAVLCLLSFTRKPGSTPLRSHLVLRALGGDRYSAALLFAALSGELLVLGCTAGEVGEAASLAAAVAAGAATSTVLRAVAHAKRQKTAAVAGLVGGVLCLVCLPSLCLSPALGAVWPVASLVLCQSLQSALVPL